MFHHYSLRGSRIYIVYLYFNINSTPTEESRSPLFSPPPEDVQKASEWDTLQASLENEVDNSSERDNKQPNAQNNREIELEHSLSAQQSEIDNLKKQNDDNLTNLNEKNNTIDALEKTIVELKNSSTDNQELTTLERKVDSIQAELMSNRQAHDDTRSTLTELEQERNQQRTENETIEHKLKESSEQLLRSKLDCKNSREELEKVRQENTTIKEQLETSTKTSEELRNTNEQLNAQLAELKDANTEKQRLEEELSKLTIENKTLISRLTTLDRDNASLKRTIEESQDNLSLDKEASAIPLNTNGQFVTAAARSLIPSSVMHKRRESLQMLKIRMNSQVSSPEMSSINEEPRMPRNQFMTNDDPLFFCAACETEEDQEGQGLIVL